MRLPQRGDQNSACGRRARGASPSLGAYRSRPPLQRGGRDFFVRIFSEVLGGVGDVLVPPSAPAAHRAVGAFLSGIFASPRPVHPIYPAADRRPAALHTARSRPTRAARPLMALRATAAAPAAPDARDDALPVHLVADLGAPLAVPIVRRDPARAPLAPFPAGPRPVRRTRANVALRAVRPRQPRLPRARRARARPRRRRVRAALRPAALLRRRRPRAARQPLLVVATTSPTPAPRWPPCCRASPRRRRRPHYGAASTPSTSSCASTDLASADAWPGPTPPTARLENAPTATSPRHAAAAPSPAA